MVCVDLHYPEAPRLAAQMDAEIILVPFAADGRLKEDGYARGAEYSGRAFALENRIPVIFSATLDLEAKVIQAWTGEDFHALQIVGRRPELYNGLGVH